MNNIIVRRILWTTTLALVALSAGPSLDGYATSGRSWATSTVRYYVNARNKWMSESAAVAALQTGAAAWHEQSNANVQLSYAGTTTGTSLTMNYKAEVFFRDTTSSHVAEAYYWWDGSGRLVDGDIVFYEGSYQFFFGSGCANGIYLENVAVHEFGHVLGLLHSAVPGVTMQPAMQSYCDRTQLTLEPDDVDAIQSLYPPSSGGTTNTAPSVTITAPANNSSHAGGSAITFTGSASDTQDGNLTSSLRWSSSLAGQIGTGGNFTATLGAGTHVITASVTDRGNLTSVRQVTVTVSSTAPAPAPAPDPGTRSLSARGYKAKGGLQTVDLTWTGFSATMIDVFRNGVRVNTVQNQGRVTDMLNKKGGGSYTYKVCDAGTSSCSNNASVSF